MQNQCRIFLKDLGWSAETLTARETGMPNVFFVFKFFAGKANFLSINNDNVISAVNVWSVRRLVFSPQYHCNLGSKAAHYLVVGIYNKPFFFNGFIVGGNSLISWRIHDKII